MKRARLRTTRCAIHCPECDHDTGYHGFMEWTLEEFMLLLEKHESKIISCEKCGAEFVLHRKTIFALFWAEKLDGKGENEDSR